MNVIGIKHGRLTRITYDIASYRYKVKFFTGNRCTEDDYFTKDIKDAKSRAQSFLDNG